MTTIIKKPDSAAVTARIISKILREHGFQKADYWTEGYYVHRVGHSRSVSVDYRVIPHNDRARRRHQVEQMREVLFELGYVSSHPKAIYIDCLNP